MDLSDLLFSVVLVSDSVGLTFSEVRVLVCLSISVYLSSGLKKKARRFIKFVTNQSIGEAAGGSICQPVDDRDLSINRSHLSIYPSGQA